MREIVSKVELDEFLKSESNRVIYIGAESCSVCVDLYPKIEKVMAKYDKLEFFKVEYSKFPELRGLLSVYTVPAIIGYIDGKEFLREARFISVEDITQKLDRYSEFLE